MKKYLSILGVAIFLAQPVFAQSCPVSSSGKACTAKMSNPVKACPAHTGGAAPVQKQNTKKKPDTYYKNKKKSTYYKDSKPPTYYKGANTSK